jgi:hypothetical protein
VAGRLGATVASVVQQFNSINRRRTGSKKGRGKNDPDLRRNNEDKEVKVKTHTKKHRIKGAKHRGKNLRNNR